MLGWGPNANNFNCPNLLLILMRFQPFTAAIAFAPLLCGVARADDVPKTDNLLPSAPEAQNELWKNSQLGAVKKEFTPAQQSQFTDAATQQFSLVAGLREWRDTFDGRGKFASRDLMSGEVLGSKAKFSLGRVAPPSLAGVSAGAGISAQWGALEIGSTLRPRELDESLADFDRALIGKKPGVAEAQNVTWLRAKPFAGKDGDLELNVSRAQRDVAAGAAVKMRTGTFMGAGGGLNLPMKWKFNGNYALAAMQDAKDDKSSWSAKLGGPISHPLGKADVAVEWSDTAAGYSTLGSSDVNGGTAGNARLTQEIKTDALTGQIKLAATQRERRNLAAAKTGDTLENRDANALADLKLKVTPNLSLKANGAVGAAQIVRAGDDFAASLQAGQNGSMENVMRTEETQNQGGDVGVEWNLNKELAFSATVGTSQTLGWRDDAAGASTAATAPWTPFNQSEENRLGFQLSHKDKAGTLLAKYATRSSDDEKLANWQSLQTLRLQAQRPLFFGVKVNTIVDLAHGNDGSWADQNNIARRVEAQLQFNRAARLDLNFRDGAALPGQWLADPMSAPFRPTGGGAWSTGDKEFGARINAGSAAGGNGLGLALEYARQERKGTDNDQWRVGVTWK